MKVIGTAGHIDHGKSALVRALTGIDPDRLMEEKRRGLTIDLGFAWLRLPSGEVASIVDVPGHERFVKNMLAGAAGVDMALLVVAADEGVMPQTREHVDILNLLGIKTAVVAITKTDLASDDLLSLVEDDVRSLLAPTPLSRSEIVGVSSVTQKGIPELVCQIDRAIQSAPPRDEGETPFLPIDRVFSRAGFGTIATGTLHGGSLRSGQEVEIFPAGRRGRIRGLHVHEQPVEEAPAGARVAVNVSGIDRDELARGDVLALPASIHPTRRFDALALVVSDAPFPLKHATAVSLHVGTGEHRARVSVLGRRKLEAGEQGWIQLRLDEPVPAVPRQRFVLRLPAPGRTIAGGEIVDISPRHRTSDPKAVKRLEAIISKNGAEAIAAVLPDDRPRSISFIAAAARVPPLEAETILQQLETRDEARKVEDAYLSGQGWERLCHRAVTALAAYHERFPLKPGMPKEELRRKLGFEPTEWPAVLASLAHTDVLREDGPQVAAPAHSGGSQTRQADAERVLEVLHRQRFAPPSGKELLDEAGVQEELLLIMAAEGSIVRLSDGLFLARDAYDEMLRLTLETIQANDQVTASEVRDAFGTSRKYAIAFLEHLDSERITRRVGDARQLGSKAARCA